MSHQSGFNAHRLHPEAQNYREQAFAEEWIIINSNKYHHKPILDYMIPDWTERDAKVAATVIQWLGSNVGIGFINDVIEKSQFVKDSIRK